MMLTWACLAIAPMGTASAAPVEWGVMQAGAEALQPLLPSRARWERMVDAHAVDLLEPIGQGRLVVGHLNVANQGVPIPGVLEGWDGRTGERLWQVRRRLVEGGVWEVLHAEPLVVAGRGVAESVLMALDPETGETLWSTSSERSLVEVMGETVVIWRRGQLEGLSRLDGSTVWAVPMALPAEIRVSQDTLIAELGDSVVALDASWGAEDWRIEGAFAASPTPDALNVALYDGSVVNWLDAFGQPLWTWNTPEGRIKEVSGIDGRAVVVVEGSEGDQVYVVEDGASVGQTGLDGRLASSLLAINGVFALTTEDEIVAFAANDASLAFRKPLPELFLGWGPNDRPDLPHGQPDVLVEYEEEVVVIRERAGLATYDAAHFGAGQLQWWHGNASVGLDPMTVGGRFEELAAAMMLLEDPRQASRADGHIQRRRIEFEAALRRARGELAGPYALRPFRRPAADGTGAHGVTLVDVAEGTRADVAYAPLFSPVVEGGVDLPAVVVDVPNRQIIVASTAPDPVTWTRVRLGRVTVPGISVRAIALSDLTFRDDASALAAIDALYPPLGQSMSSPVDDSIPEGLLAAGALLEQVGGVSDSNCLEQGILEQERADVVALCLEKGVDLATGRIDGVVPFLEAVDRNHLETVRKLLDAGADPNFALETDERRPIERATDPDLIVLLEGRGAVARTAGEVKSGLKRLLRLSGLRKPNGAWCFHHASKGRTDVLDACLAKKRTGVLDYVDAEKGHLLHVAAASGRVVHVRALIGAGANPNVLDREGVTPLGRLDGLGELDDGQTRAARVIEEAGGL